MKVLENSYSSTLWGVHVVGAGSILAANSFSEAVEKSAQINQMVVGHIAPKASKYSPLIFAAPVIWINVSGDIQHNPNETDWDDIC